MRRLATLSCCVIGLFSSVATATNIFNLEGFGPISRSLGGAGVAHNIGASAMMYNPATLGLMEKGSQVHVGLDVVGTDINTRNRATGEDATSGKESFIKNRGPIYFAPEFAVTHSRNTFTFGVGAFAQGGLGTEFGRKSFLSKTTVNGIDTGLENSSRLLNLRIPLAASFKVNDKLTVGASVDAVWTQLNLELLLDASQVGTLIGNGRVTGGLVPVLAGLPALSGAHFSFTNDRFVGGGVDAWGLGGKIGLTYQILDNTRLGVSYNFKTNVSNLHGRATLTAIDAVLGQIPLRGDIKIRDFQNPAQLSIGIDHKLNKQWTVVADYQRVYWQDVMENIDVGFRDDASGANINILLPQDYRDINIYTIGAEYAYNNNWSFRGGYSHADQAVKSNLLFAVVPGILQNHITGGLTYAWNNSSKVDFALAYALKKQVTNSSQPNTSVPIKSSHSQINAVVAYVYKF